MSKVITITPEEAMLIDWVLTMHSYDSLRLEQLEAAEMVGLRKKVAIPITYDQMQEIDFNDNEVQYLLISIPITFRFFKEDIGFSLKRKLLATLVPRKVNWDLEVKDGLPNENRDPGKDSPLDQTEGSP